MVPLLGFRNGGSRDAAQPLQYSMGEGWDDGLAPQGFAGQVLPTGEQAVANLARMKEEEMAQ
ncbi:MAG: hypothetical protein GY910_14910 [bacterium]|nr:hypothetical protein [bacterium]